METPREPRKTASPRNRLLPGKQAPRYCTFPFDLASPRPTEKARKRHPGPTDRCVRPLGRSPRPLHSALGTLILAPPVSPSGERTKPPPESSLCVPGTCGQVVSPVRPVSMASRGSPLPGRAASLDQALLSADREARPDGRACSVRPHRPRPQGQDAAPAPGLAACLATRAQ